MLNSYFYPFDDNHSYFPSRYEHFQRKRAHEAALRRRREAEFEYRRQQQEDLKRQAYEQERIRREREIYRQDAQKMGESRYQDPAYSVMRGADGRLYRFPISEQSREDSQIVRGSDGRLYRLRKSVEDDAYSPPLAGQKLYRDEHTVRKPIRRELQLEEESLPSVDEPLHFAASTRQPFMPVTESLRKPSRTLEKIPSKPRRKRITVVVEDASDSEYENDEHKSTWRNRVPSPNESWMEPISMP
jgi:hypothetical protein